jgi:hypothetical protein
MEWFTIHGRPHDKTGKRDTVEDREETQKSQSQRDFRCSVIWKLIADNINKVFWVYVGLSTLHNLSLKYLSLHGSWKKTEKNLWSILSLQRSRLFTSQPRCYKHTYNYNHIFLCLFFYTEWIFIITVTFVKVKFPGILALSIDFPLTFLCFQLVLTMYFSH